MSMIQRSVGDNGRYTMATDQRFCSVFDRQVRDGHCIFMNSARMGEEKK